MYFYCMVEGGILLLIAINQEGRKMFYETMFVKFSPQPVYGLNLTLKAM